MLKHMLLKEVKVGALAYPESLKLVQITDDGVKFYDLVAPEGYTCLGSIAVKKDEQPDLTRYCCPKNKYLTDAEHKLVFKWPESFIYTPTRSSPSGVIASTFKATFKPLVTNTPPQNFCQTLSLSTPGSDYKGTVSQTKSGLKCQMWAAQSPHEHEMPFNDEDENYCRNPDGSDGVWCYTTDKNTRWDYCSVPDRSKGVCISSIST